MTKQTETYFIAPSELKLVISHLKRQSTYFIAGINSIYVPAGRRKYVDKTIVKPWPDSEGEIRQMTPGEAARTELMREWPDLKRVGWPGKLVSLLDWRSPMLFAGAQAGPMMYIDLDAAYSQIYEKLWLDVAYPRGYYGRYPLKNVAERLKIWKAARNSLIGITRSRQGVAYRGQRRIVLKMKNRYLSPGLWATTQNLLHMVMAKAIECGAVYGNVDGFVFKLSLWEEIEEFTFWMSDLGFRWSIRSQGEGEIVSWNNYSIGGKATKAYKLNLSSSNRSFNNVCVNNEGWENYWRNCQKIASQAA